MKASDLRVGNIVIMNGELYRCAEAIHKTPGNLRAFIQAKLVRLKDGIQKEMRFASSDDIEKAMLETHDMQFLYADQGILHFMNTENYEQTSTTAELLGPAAHYLLPEALVQMTFYEEKPIGINLPPAMEFEVVEAEPSMRSATATSSYKNAKISTGHTIKVPQFIEVGDRIRVNPNTDQYLERGKGK